MKKTEKLTIVIAVAVGVVEFISALASAKADESKKKFYDFLLKKHKEEEKNEKEEEVIADL